MKIQHRIEESPVVGAADTSAVRGVSPGLARSARTEYDRLRKARLRYNILSFAFGLPGFVLIALSSSMKGAAPASSADPKVEAATALAIFLVSAVFWIPGILLLCAGLAFASKAKGRSGTWGVVGVLCCFGLIILACLKDHTGRRLKELKLQLKGLGESA